MEEIELGKYRIFLSENEVAVKRNEETIYRGKLCQIKMAKARERVVGCGLWEGEEKRQVTGEAVANKY